MSFNDTVIKYLENLKGKVEALTDKEGDLAFLRVWLSPAVDVDALMKVPRFPTALINDGGGSKDPANLVLDRRTVLITIVDHHPRDHIGEEALKAILALGDQLEDGLKYLDDLPIYLTDDSDVTSYTVDRGTKLVAKSFVFTYEIRRE